MTASSPMPAPQDWQVAHHPADHTGPGYAVYQRGSHADGTYIRVYVPEQARSPRPEPLRAITYLHGFALCMPSFYEAHLVELVRQGNLVFFPDFQRSLYPDTPPGAPAAVRQERRDAALWRGVLQQTADIDAEEEVFPATLRKALGVESDDSGGAGIPAAALRRTLWPLLVVLALLEALSWFRRRYGRNLIHLLSTVALSLAVAPRQWLEMAIDRVDGAWADLSGLDDFRHWAGQCVQPVAFGHSLGGLLALSLPSAYRHRADQRFAPSQVLVADPAASSEMGIPRLAIWLLKLFGAPFTADPLRITSTGAALSVPVAILHGAADRLVPPDQWATARGGPGPNFTAIASTSKALLFSCSNPEAAPPLVAFHNQAVTSTAYYDDALFRSFGGVKHGANAYNTQFIWPALRLLLCGEATPRQLIERLCPCAFRVEPLPPP
ncbi:hypothetical protein [Cyanobium sp. PCC 7001]|uniref:hypothetical protein n=1 Tax=Cyanobium sp. PCC 7001 TaxID=180281 RepID=UPI0012EACC99|nr:hypothetical protein [Cyanobium sp. PCC 7001]